MDDEIPDDLALTPQERSELTPKAHRYIVALEKKIEQQRIELRTTGDELRRKRFSYWDRSR
ncbi:MAG TPA: hypothetical protein VN612_17255 [Acidobacteriaceae bacterium]|nr:hypothetical protein [Acidobacteriaceae bacterium]